MSESIRPKALKPGDTIAFVSPSLRLNDTLPNAIARGKAYIESFRFKVRVIYKPLSESSSIKDSIRVKLEELHEAFADPEIKAIICTLGGNHANELLPFLDYKLLKRNPKIFIGYSDTTFLHYGLYSKAGLRTFYGPTVLSDFADIPNPIQFTIDHFLHVLTKPDQPIGAIPRSLEFAGDDADFLFGNDNSTVQRTLAPSPKWRWLRKGTATGRLFGGTMRPVVELTGQPTYSPSTWKDKILFLETAMGGNLTDPYPITKLRNHFVNLALAGVLSEIQGLVIGRAYKYDQGMQDELASVVTEVLDAVAGRKEGECPVLMNVDFGHTSPILTLPYGALARLDREGDEFAVLESGVE